MAALPGIKLATDSQCQTVGSLEAAASSAPNARWAYGAKSTTLGTTTTFLMPCARKSFAKCSDTAKTRWAPSYARRSRAPKSGWSNQLCALDQCSVTTYGTPHRRARTRASTPPGKPMFPCTKSGRFRPGSLRNAWRAASKAKKPGAWRKNFQKKLRTSHVKTLGSVVIHLDCHQCDPCSTSTKSN